MIKYIIIKINKDSKSKYNFKSQIYPSPSLSVKFTTCECIGLHIVAYTNHINW